MVFGLWALFVYMLHTPVHSFHLLELVWPEESSCDGRMCAPSAKVATQDRIVCLM